MGKKKVTIFYEQRLSRDDKLLQRDRQTVFKIKNAN